MSNYSKLTNFATKDTLVSGNPLKVIKGTEIDDEFEDIETHMATKADLASPVLTGTPRAPTAAAGNNGTQIASTAFVQNAISNITPAYPVGSIYINASSSTNPATLLGYGTWVAFGTGRALVGIDTGQTEFNTVGKTGGAKTHTLTIAEMPSHTHTVQPTYNDNNGTQGIRADAQNTANVTPHTSSSTGGDGAHNNLQPYITVYMWQRTA
jgi:hypothetical protein